MTACALITSITLAISSLSTVAMTLDSSLRTSSLAFSCCCFLKASYSGQASVSRAKTFSALRILRLTELELVDEDDEDLRDLWRFLSF